MPSREMRLGDLQVGQKYQVGGYVDGEWYGSDVAILVEKGRTYLHPFPQTITSLVTIEYLPEDMAPEKFEAWRHRIPGAHPPDLAEVHPGRTGLLVAIEPAHLREIP